MTARNRKVLIRTALTIVLTILVYFIGLQTPAVKTPSSESSVPASTVPLKAGNYRVLEVADGDTFSVNMDGSSETIRLIGVDTPETQRPNTPVQCFGKAASAFTKDLLIKQGLQVRLEAEPLSTNRDRYNRLLRYAYLQDGRLLNRLIIEEGYGFAYTSFPFEKSESFEAAETAAKSAGKGLWGTCSTTEYDNGIRQTQPANE